MGAPSLPEDLRKVLRAAVSYGQPLESNVASFMESYTQKNDKRATDMRDGPASTMTHLQLCVRLQGEIMNLESESKKSIEFERRISALLTSECIIYDLNRHKPLQNNPFLSHWVLTAARLQQRLWPTTEIDSQRIAYWRTRLSLLEAILASMHRDEPLHTLKETGYTALSPQFIANRADTLKMIDLRPFIGIMRIQGAHIPSDLLAASGPKDPSNPASSARTIQLNHDQWRTGQHDIVRLATELEGESTTHGDARWQLLKSHSSSQNSSGPEHQTIEPMLNHDRTFDVTWTVVESALESKTKIVNKGKLPIQVAISITPQSSPEDIKSALKDDHEGTLQTLKRFPLDLQALDLLTRSLEGDILTEAGVNTGWFVLEYVQHCLRLIDHLGTSRSPASDPDEPYNAYVVAGVPAGREEQARAVKLLILFMKNLLHKGFLPVQELAYDFQEIDVRYMWVPEAREFGNLLEGNALLDDADAVPTSAFGVGG